LPGVFEGGTFSRRYGVLVRRSCIEILEDMEIVLFLASLAGDEMN